MQHHASQRHEQVKPASFAAHPYRNVSVASVKEWSDQSIELSVRNFALFCFCSWTRFPEKKQNKQTTKAKAFDSKLLFSCLRSVRALLDCRRVAWQRCRRRRRGACFRNRPQRVAARCCGGAAKRLGPREQRNRDADQQTHSCDDEKLTRIRRRIAALLRLLSLRRDTAAVLVLRLACGIRRSARR